MALAAYVTLKGKKQGDLKGESGREKHKKAIEVLAFNHRVSIPIDIATSQPSGRRVHSPIVITKEWGAASPQILQACTTGEQITEVKFEFFRTSPQGEEELYFKIGLKNATVVSVEPFTEVVPGGASHARGSVVDVHELERVGLVYETIEWESVLGKTMATDDWKK